MRTWGHKLAGADPWGGWTFIERNNGSELCPKCHWIDPVAANDYVPPAKHLSLVLNDVQKAGLLSAFDHRELMSAEFGSTLISAGVPEQVLRPLPHDLYTFDYLAMSAAACTACEPSDLCAVCGRVRMWHRRGPSPNEVVIEDPGDQPIVRSAEVFGRGYERNWVIYVSNPIYDRLGFPRDNFEVLVAD